MQKDGCGLQFAPAAGEKCKAATIERVHQPDSYKKRKQSCWCDSLNSTPRDEG